MEKPSRVAVIGAGIAGAHCARLLADSGHAVQVFDKSRGAGGRMATRRLEWLADDGEVQRCAVDHGAPAFTAQSPEFTQFAAQAQHKGWLSPWAAEMSSDSHQPLGDLGLWVAQPDMPSLCRRMLEGIPLNLSCTVDALHRDDSGWRLESAGTTLGEGYSHVVLAVPAPQAAPLLQPHRADWAHQAATLQMLPCWTLMGLIERLAPTPTWSVAWPKHGPLAWIVRNACKPSRDQPAALEPWTVHGTAPWSQTHLENNAADVQALLQQAVAQWLGATPIWRHATVHRWRYASVARSESSVPGRCWWDASLGLGACGDAWGGAGVEGAWTSARALAGMMRDSRAQAHPA